MERQKEEAEIEEGGMDGKGGKREGSMKAEEGGGGGMGVASQQETTAPGVPGIKQWGHMPSQRSVLHKSKLAPASTQGLEEEQKKDFASFFSCRTSQ